uniref:Solute carrier family 12 member 9 n=1 Tax=Anas platyrhynchos TaxID=8839 RepID=A0A8B9SQT2_ANAPL
MASSERSALLTYRLCGGSAEEERGRERGRAAATTTAAATSSSSSSFSSSAAAPRKLPTFLGVVVPTLLSMFSVVLFLRLGFVVGHAGLYQALAMFAVAYFIIGMTVLSVCAIATNGALDAWGSLLYDQPCPGPGVRGKHRDHVFPGQCVWQCPLHTGAGGGGGGQLRDPTWAKIRVQAVHVLPQSYWYELLYGTILLALCLVVCLVGASIYAKATFLIFLIVTAVLGTILVSFFATRPLGVPIRMPHHNSSETESGNFTGFSLATLRENLGGGYGVDYTTGQMMSFSSVFAVMFNGCTGIMAGSNMSGDLKRPSYSIPRGTISAVLFTYLVYNLLAFLMCATCSRTLLQKDYGFLRDISIFPPLVTVGIYAATLSAAMSNLIGASRILYALARDDLFGRALALAKKTSASGNPIMAVILSWLVVQLVLFSGKLNTIAGVVTTFFLLVYCHCQPGLPGAGVGIGPQLQAHLPLLQLAHVPAGHRRLLRHDVPHQPRLGLGEPGLPPPPPPRPPLPLAQQHVGLHQPGPHLPPGEEVPADAGRAEGPRQVLAPADAADGAEPTQQPPPHRLRQRPQEERPLRPGPRGAAGLGCSALGPAAAPAGLVAGLGGQAERQGLRQPHPRALGAARRPAAPLHLRPRRHAPQHPGAGLLRRCSPSGRPGPAPRLHQRPRGASFGLPPASGARRPQTAVSAGVRGHRGRRLEDAAQRPAGPAAGEPGQGLGAAASLPAPRPPSTSGPSTCCGPTAPATPTPAASSCCRWPACSTWPGPGVGPASASSSAWRPEPCPAPRRTSSASSSRTCASRPRSSWCLGTPSSACTGRLNVNVGPRGRRLRMRMRRKGRL